MFTKEDILTRLQNGETADTIANEMSKLLNEANAAHKDLVKRQEEEAKRKAEEEKQKKIEEARRQEEEHRNQMKLSELQDIINYLADWLYDWYGITIDPEEEAKAEEVIDLVDFMIKYFKSLKDLTNIILPKGNINESLFKKEYESKWSDKKLEENTESVIKSVPAFKPVPKGSSVFRSKNPDQVIQDFLDKMML